MDSNSIEDVQMKEGDSVDSTEEEAPKILSPEIHDIFHIFASMLDLKSFMKLAMTSKNMYKRCMEDKEIRIKVNEDRFDICGGEVTRLNFKPYDIPEKSIDSYIAALRKLSCIVNLGSVRILASEGAASAVINAARRYLREMGVKRIEKLSLRCHFDDSAPVISFIKVFHVSSLEIRSVIPWDIPPSTLKPILQLNLKKLYFGYPVSVDFLLEIDSPIQEIHFPNVARISKEELTEIMSKIQSGSLHHLTLEAMFRFTDFDILPFDHRASLPDDRPLLLARISKLAMLKFAEFWFLHWHGPVTKCDFNLNPYTLEMYKCEPWELPYILRKEEDILMNLTEKRPKVYCDTNHFQTFCSSLTMVDPSHQGPLPDERPLYCKVSEKQFWMLDEYDDLMECNWKKGCAIWKPFDPCSNEPEKIGHPALAKYIFWKVVKEVKQVKGYDRFILHCEGLEEFKKWFEDFEILDFEYLGALPSGRPVVFEDNSPQPKGSHCLLVFHEDRLVECNFTDNHVCIHPRRGLYRPTILLTASHVVKMLKAMHTGNLQIRIRFETLRDGLMQFKQYLVFQDRFLVSEEPSEFWYWHNGAIGKAAWKEERLSISTADLCEAPPNFMKQVFRYFAENTFWEKQTYCRSFHFNFEQFKRCLEQFRVVPFDYSGPLTSDPPLAFVKENIWRSLCKEGACSEEYFPVWILWEDMRLTHCVWRNYEPKTLIFTIATVGMPPALKSKEYLKLLFQTKYNDKSYRYEWFGTIEEFIANVEDFVKLPFEYDGPLPKERPLLFENSSTKRCPIYFLLREDGTTIQCMHQTTYSISLFSPSPDDVPLALKSCF